MSLIVRFANLFNVLKDKNFVGYYDVDGTLTKEKTGENEADIRLYRDVLPTIDAIKQRGSDIIISSARSMAELTKTFGTKITRSANDGYVISIPERKDVIFGSGVQPDYTKFKYELQAFTANMVGVTIKDMGVYCGLFINQDHPQRSKCEEFFQQQVNNVSVISKNLPMVWKNHPMGITMEPKENRGKCGVIDFLRPMYSRDSILIVAGDADNDIPALRFAKENGGVAIKVQQGKLLGVPEYATHEVKDAKECVRLLMMMLQYI